VRNPHRFAQNLGEVSGHVGKPGRVDEVPVGDAMNVSAVGGAPSRVDKSLKFRNDRAIKTHPSHRDFDYSIRFSKPSRLEVHDAEVDRMHRLIDKTGSFR